MASTIIPASSSALSPANHSLRITLLTKISGRSDNGLRVKAKAQAPEKFSDCIYRQNFTIRSYEVGHNRMATIGTLLNHLQETIVSHMRDVGLVGDGFHSTPEMTRRNLIWVVAKMQILVDQYPCWGDAVEIDNWFGGAAGKNGIANHWLIRNANTGETLAEANSVWIMMNKETRKVSKFPDQVRDEMAPITMDYHILDDNKLSKLHDNTADSVHNGLTVRWSDLDINHHVNFVKYIEWILQDAPTISENWELCDMVLEFRRECRVGDKLKSLTRVVETGGYTECQHMLQLENGKEVVRGRTKWQHTTLVDKNMLAKKPLEV
ncbi:hypothetical protein MKW92_052725 [Papaver armeniacum]|nr:hypothetical protein MKW92_052725 [Papaver armeniacum]